MLSKSSRKGRRGQGRKTEDLADRLHSAAIHLLRKLRLEDDASGLTSPRLSALSVVVFAGPMTLGALASAEQVRPPTISRLVKDLERLGLVRREPDPEDQRTQRVSATPKGRRVLDQGRKRRIAKLAGELERLSADDRRRLWGAVALLECLALPDGHPGKRG